MKKGIRYLVSMRGKPFWWERMYPTSYSSSVSSDRWSVSTVSPCHRQCILYSDGELLHYLWNHYSSMHECILYIQLLHEPWKYVTNQYVDCEWYDGIHELQRASSSTLVQTVLLQCTCTSKSCNTLWGSWILSQVKTFKQVCKVTSH